MICIVGTRRSGRTTKLIELSNKTGIPIVTSNERSARYIMRMALKMGLNIPRPEARAFSPNAYGRQHRTVLLDEAQTILETLIGSRVEVAVFDARQFDFSTLSLLELIAAWWRSRRIEKIEEPIEEIHRFNGIGIKPLKEVKIKDPRGKIRRIRFIPNINGFGATAYVRVGLFIRDQQFAADEGGAIANLIKRLTKKGWEVVK